MADEQLGTDILFGSDLGVMATGDLATVSGFSNLAQAIADRLRTVRGSLPEDPEYGSDLFDLISDPDTPAFRALARQIIRDAVVEDPRVARVDSVEVRKAAPDKIEFTVGIMTITGATGTVGGVV